MRRSNRRGAVLIVVLGVLSVLSLLGVSYATIQSIERSTARNYLDGVRARLVARAGVEQALDELSQMARRDLVPSGPEAWRYWGADMQENGSAPANVPLEQALNPSFAVEVDGNPATGPVTPKQVTIEGAARGYSGVLGGTYQMNGDMFVLNVRDAAGRLWINEGLTHSGGNQSTASKNLKRILNRLGAAAMPPVATLGDRVLANRPVGGYQSVSALGSFLTTAEYDAVAECLTAHAWVDANVANPVPLTAAHAQALQAETGVTYYRGTPAIYRFGRGRDHLGALITAPLQAYPATSSATFQPNSLGHAVYAMDELNPQWIEITSRAPVNVNTAPRAVLIALLADLRGVFMSERRRNNIESGTAGGYHYLKVKHTYSPANMPIPPEKPLPCYNVPEGDELGFLYETYPIVGPGSTASGVSASTIADEIIACRRKLGFYAGQPWGGAFRSWRQFYAFCDSLVARGIVNDPRPIFYDHAPGPIGPGNITGYTPLVTSNFERQQASQAIADVIKANFNPNLHLNELNPDRSLFLLVDKTDLCVNSTEFIFTPNGRYDIECLARVLRPANGLNDALATGAENEICAEARVHAGVKLFDLVRETSQSHFYEGTFAARTAGVATNNNKSLECGPEPDNGDGPAQNAWSGYLALPTIGGNYHAVGATKPSNMLTATPAGPSQYDETIHAHLSWDFDCHHHLDNKRMELASRDNVDPLERTQNWPDPDPTAPNVRGPYDPMDHTGNYYRLARSFALPATGSSTSTMPVLAVRAPLDLRIDGGYSERHSGLAYWISTTSYAATTRRKEGVISYWVKPNFFPERSGKPRGYADMGRRITPTTAAGIWNGWFNMAHWTNIWNPGHNAPAGATPAFETASTWSEGFNHGGTQFGVIPFKPESMIFGVGYGWACGYAQWPNGGGSNYYQFMETGSLNHAAHNDGGVSRFKAHEWMHVRLSWRKTDIWCTMYDPLFYPSIPGTTPEDYRVFINGVRVPGSLEVALRFGAENERDDQIDWTTHQNGDRNTLRFGAPSLVSGEGVAYNNFAADSTIDEIYFWKNRPYEDIAMMQWLQGRYSAPKTADEGVFTSRPIALGGTARSLPPPSSLTPTGAPPVPPSTAALTPMARVLGVSWTWFAEGSLATPNGWVPTLTDHRSAGGTLQPRVELSLAGLAPAPVTNDGYSPFVTPTGGTPEVAVGSTVQYRVAFKLPDAAPDTILLATPVVDDVTLYVESGCLFTYYHVGA